MSPMFTRCCCCNCYCCCFLLWLAVTYPPSPSPFRSHWPTPSPPLTRSRTRTPSHSISIRVLQFRFPSVVVVVVASCSACCLLPLPHDEITSCSASSSHPLSFALCNYWYIKIQQKQVEMPDCNCGHNKSYCTLLKNDCIENYKYREKSLNDTANCTFSSFNYKMVINQVRPVVVGSIFAKTQNAYDLPTNWSLSCWILPMYL